jgi:Cys-tRNA(Pro)/Cys-tRNA(Cys) deacylase
MARGATPAVVAAERAGIPFKLHEYPHDPAAPSYGMEAAEALGVSPTRVFKTLVVQVDAASLAVAIVPVAARLNLKEVSAAAHGKRAELALPVDAERATGYVVGGISPLGQKRRLRALLDRSAVDHETVFVSAGRRGLQMEIAPADLARLTQATIATLTS